jgi:hypothetical protein
MQAAQGERLRANRDGTVSVTGTMTLWQDPVPAMSFGFEEALQYCSDLSLAGISDWQLPTGVSLSKLCVINAASPVLSDSTAAYWTANHLDQVDRIVACDARGIERAVTGFVARVRCVHALSE